MYIFIRNLFLQKKQKSRVTKSPVCSSYMFGIFFHVWFFFSWKKNPRMSRYMRGFFFKFWELVFPHVSPMNLLGVFKQIKIFRILFKVKKLVALDPSQIGLSKLTWTKSTRIKLHPTPSLCIFSQILPKSTKIFLSFVGGLLMWKKIYLFKRGRRVSFHLSSWFVLLLIETG